MGYVNALEDGEPKKDQYVISCKGEPLAINEYACRLATGSSTHVLQLDDLQAGIDIDWKSEFHELVLDERPGRWRQSFCR